MTNADRNGLVPALLKHWRRQRGLSQLDLALAADVSARHVSFLETGRSVPSPEMVVLLGTTLGVPLRQINTMLRAAGHRPVFAEADDPLPDSVKAALTLMKAHQEPFPLVVLDTAYRVLDLNGAAAALFAVLFGESFGEMFEALPGGAAVDPVALNSVAVNLARLTFDPEGAQPFLANFDEIGRQLLWRIQREVLADPDDTDLAELLEELLAMPTVDPRWRQIDLSAPSDPALVVHLNVGGLDLRFITTVTAFQAPQNVAVEQLRIEAWYPADDATAAACRALVDS